MINVSTIQFYCIFFRLETDNLYINTTLHSLTKYTMMNKLANIHLTACLIRRVPGTLIKYTTISFYYSQLLSLAGGLGRLGRRRQGRGGKGGAGTGARCTAPPSSRSGSRQPLGEGMPCQGNRTISSEQTRSASRTLFGSLDLILVEYVSPINPQPLNREEQNQETDSSLSRLRAKHWTSA